MSDVLPYEEQLETISRKLEQVDDDLAKARKEHSGIVWMAFAGGATSMLLLLSIVYAVMRIMGATQ